MTTISLLSIVTAVVILILGSSYPGNINHHSFIFCCISTLMYLSCVVVGQELEIQIPGLDDFSIGNPPDLQITFPTFTPPTEIGIARRKCYPACGGGAGFCHGRCLFFGLRCVQGSCSRSPYF